MLKSVLYAGDSAVGGAANYLLGVLRYGGFKVSHVPPSQPLSRAHLKGARWGATLLSDYAAKQCSKLVQDEIGRQVSQGSGLMMVGGWASFSGPFGGWQDSKIERLLPVRCLGRDDRTNFPSGAAVQLKTSHPALDPRMFKNPPVICGINHVQVKESGRIILSARPLSIDAGKSNVSVRLKGEFPLLALGKNPAKRVAAYASDFAPHWCGGLADWGRKTLKLSVAPGIPIEVVDY